jgi:release factor glutamine methyltransferase
MANLNFNHQWYNNLVTYSDEKQLIISAIKRFATIRHANTCLEIGMGTQRQFSEKLIHQFREYTIIEKEPRQLQLPAKVTFIQADWERATLTRQYDVIIASHVWYYFNDKATAVRKMLKALTENGILILVLNGPDGDYGQLKRYFSELIGQPYRFAYDEFYETPDLAHNRLEFTIPSTIRFPDHESLYSALQLGFDQYPDTYLQLKTRMMAYLQEHFKQHTFVINQKLIVMQHHPIPWEYLLQHPDYQVSIENLPLAVKDGVFTPDPLITWSTTWLLKHLPPVAGKDVLDIGSGTGVIAIQCALQGAGRIVAADIDERAVRNIRENLQIHGLVDRVEAIHSDLFKKIRGRYDHIFGNLPILDEVWGQQESNAMIGLLKRFLISCPQYIKPGGSVYFSWASFAPVAPVLSLLGTLAYRYTTKTTTKDKIDWHLFIIQFT